MEESSIEAAVGEGGAPQGLPPASSWPDVGHQLEQSEAGGSGRKLSQSSDLSSETESTCTVLQRETGPSLSSVQRFEDQEQILSAQALAANFVEDKSDSATRQEAGANEPRELVEIDLSEPGADESERKSGEQSNMYHNHQHQHHDPNQQTAGVYRAANQQQQGEATEHNHLHHFRGFGEAPPKISFASRRMKEYFESFKGHSGETRRLYQFFKSIRTELVACFLFTLITSQALITCRTQLSSAANGGGEPSPSWWLAATASSDHTTSVVLQADGPNRKYPLNVHLAQGVMVAFTVASLTQVFGHISGCHLIPSVSLALYVKGHISRGRLTSYLAAQTVGAAMGVSLLSVLTSSQLTPDEFRQSLETLRSRQLSRSHQLQVVSSVVPQAAPMSPNMFLSGDRLRRRRRDTSGGSESAGGPLETDSNPEEPLEGSETILLSIMEQQQELQGSKLKRHSAPTTATTTTGEPGGELGKTITANASTYSGGQRQLGAANVSTASAPSGLETLLAAPGRPGPTSPPSSSSDWPQPTTTPPPPPPTPPPPATSAAPNPNDRSRNLAGSPSRLWVQRAATLASSTAALPELLQQRRPLQQQQQQQHSGYSQQREAPSDFRPDGDGPMIRRRRMKRNRQQAPSAEANTAASEGLAGPRASYYINLLEFGLPEQIMSSESIRQCIDKQPAGLAGGQANLSELASRGFSHCLSLSNSSQMFVFQFLATLLVVLTYLVNVDPRRVDVGFKSLSIGLAYFVAGLVTVQSGGFFGSPFQLIFLSWLSPTGEWQTEWFIYLATPLIGGLFGAISHEYIDFTSPRNRNKQLHLRRSFYSLENLPAEVNNAAPGELNNAHTMMLSSSAASYGHQHHHLQHLHHQNPMLQSGLGPPTEVGPSAEPLVPAVRHSRKISAESSSSLESASSSILTLTAGPHHTQENLDQAAGPQAELGPCRPKTPKKPSYAKQLKLEHQQHLKAATRQQANQLCAPNEVTASTKSGQRMSLRRSDFDSNFLISSSSSPTANPRNHFHQHQHQHQHQLQLQQNQITTNTSGWM